jgi:hypothetical protein
MGMRPRPHSLPWSPLDNPFDWTNEEDIERDELLQRNDRVGARKEGQFDFAGFPLVKKKFFPFHHPLSPGLDQFLRVIISIFTSWNPSRYFCPFFVSFGGAKPTKVAWGECFK